MNHVAKNFERLEKLSNLKMSFDNEWTGKLSMNTDPTQGRDYSQVLVTRTIARHIFSAA